jgi:hypothetical protein
MTRSPKKSGVTPPFGFAQDKPHCKGASYEGDCGTGRIACAT